MTTASDRQEAAARRPRAARSLLALGVLAIAFAIAVLSVAGYVLGVAATAPDLNELKPQRQGRDLGDLRRRRLAARLRPVGRDPHADPVAPTCRWRCAGATVAIEDERFYKHKGVDYNAIVRAGVQEPRVRREPCRAARPSPSSSCAPSTSRTPKRNFARKIREAKLASELEKEHSKTLDPPQLPERRPVRDRRRAHRDRRRGGGGDLLRQARTGPRRWPSRRSLAGLPQAPSQYNPFRNPAAALERRNEVLDQMVEERLHHARARPSRRQARRSRSSTAPATPRRREPYFFDFVQEQLIEKYGVGVYPARRAEGHTTIDPALQEAARKRDRRAARRLSADPSSAIVSHRPVERLHPRDGLERHLQGPDLQPRRPGPPPARLGVQDVRPHHGDPQGRGPQPHDLRLQAAATWTSARARRHGRSKTYDGSYGGTMTLASATLASDNTVYAQLILDVGPKAVRETAKLMGITTKLDAYPAEGLGGLRLGVSPLEMADAYATLASGGIRNKPKAINEGRVPGREVGRPRQAQARARVLRRRGLRGDQDPRAEHAGAAPARAREHRLPGRRQDRAPPTTSTTPGSSATRPSSPRSVWVGYPNALVEMRSVHGISVAGGTFPAAIWHDYMMVAHGDDCERFPPPTEPGQRSRPSSASTRPPASSELGQRLLRPARLLGRRDRRQLGRRRRTTRATTRASTSRRPQGAPDTSPAAGSAPGQGGPTPGEGGGANPQDEQLGGPG